MRLLIQRVEQASVEVDRETVGAIDRGLLVFLGIHQDDSENLISKLIDKLIHLRIFEDDDQKMNLSLLDTKGSILLVSQFTLYGNCKTGRRPSFVDAARPEKALELYERFIGVLREKLGEEHVQTGEFGAKMSVNLVNDGPVTLLMELP